MHVAPPTGPPRLSRKASRRFVFWFVTGALLLAFLAALGIKTAAEDPDFQKEVQKMRELHDPSFARPEPAQPTPQTPSDSTSPN